MFQRRVRDRLAVPDGAIGFECTDCERVFTIDRSCPDCDRPAERAVVPFLGQ